MLKRRPRRAPGDPTKRGIRRSATTGGGGPRPARLSPVDLHAQSSAPQYAAVIAATERFSLRETQRLTSIGRHRLQTLRKNPATTTLADILKLQSAGLLLVTIVAHRALPSFAQPFGVHRK